MNSYENRKYSETKCVDFSQVHIEAICYCFDSLLMVYEGLCGKISTDRQTDRQTTD